MPRLRQSLGFRRDLRLSGAAESIHYRSLRLSILPVKKLNRYLFPLPPLPEQRRIGVEVDRLLSLRDGLEKEVDVASEKQSLLLSSLLAAI
jgi:hypothetical protein